MVELKGASLFDEQEDAMMLPLFDGHCDIWPHVHEWSLRGEKNVFKNKHLERFNKGNVKGGIFVIWQDPFGPQNKAEELAAIRQSVLVELQDNSDLYHVIRNGNDLDAFENGCKMNVLMGIEGLSALGSNYEMVYALHDEGYRHLGLTWNEENAFATGILGDEKRGLTLEGKRLLEVMAEKKMLLDVSHANVKTVYDILEIWDGAIVASHSNVHALCDVERNLTNDQLKALASRGALIGLNAHGPFIHHEVEKQDASMLARHAAYIGDLIGVEHLAFGFDFCEFFDDMDENIKNGNAKKTPRPRTAVPTCASVGEIIEALKCVGFSEAELRKIAYQNYQRILKDLK